MNSLYKEFGPKGQVPVQPNQPMTNGPANYFQNAIQQAQQQAQQLMQRYNPQQYVLNYFKGFNIPPEIQNDPDQIAMYLRQYENMLNPLQRQVLNMMGRR